MPSPRICPPEVAIAVHNLRREKTWKDIGLIFGRKESWAKSIFVKHSPVTGLPIKERKKAGRRRKTAQDQDEAIERFALEHRDAPRTTALSAVIAKSLGESGLVNISERTVRRRLSELRKQRDNKESPKKPNVKAKKTPAKNLGTDNLSAHVTPNALC